MPTEMKLNKFSLMILVALGIIVTFYVVFHLSTHKKHSEEVVRLSELLSVSIDLAKRGGKRVVEVRRMDDLQIGQLSKGLTKSGKDEFVTLGDKESHQIIVSGMRSIWPGLPLQSEESGVPLIGVPPPSRMNPQVMAVALRDEEVPLEEVTVWVDPLDATQEYTEGKEDPSLLQFVTVMVCIAVSGHPVAGVIHQPFSGVTNWGWVGHGVSDSLQTDAGAATSGKLRLIYSRSHAGEVTKVAEAAFKDAYSIQNIEAAGSGYKVLQVVTGKADLYLHTTTIKKWDICAGNAVLNAMGGKMTTLKGQEVDYSFAGSPVNEDGLVVAKPETQQQTYLEKLRQ